jgi:hypothetical protein
MFSQTDLVGRMLKDFLNGDDYGELRQAMTEQNSMNSDDRLIVMRIKSVISQRGFKVKPKAAFMKVIYNNRQDVRWMQIWMVSIVASPHEAATPIEISQTDLTAHQSQPQTGPESVHSWRKGRYGNKWGATFCRVNISVPSHSTCGTVGSRNQLCAKLSHAHVQIYKHSFTQRIFCLANDVLPSLTR